MKYKMYEEPERIPVKGSVCLFRKQIEARATVVPAIITSVSADGYGIRWRYKDDDRGKRHLIKYVRPTGPEYAAYIDIHEQKMDAVYLVRVLGRLSRIDMKYIEREVNEDAEKTFPNCCFWNFQKRKNTNIESFIKIAKDNGFDFAHMSPIARSERG